MSRIALLSMSKMIDRKYMSTQYQSSRRAVIYKSNIRVSLMEALKTFCTGTRQHLPGLTMFKIFNGQNVKAMKTLMTILGAKSTRCLIQMKHK